MNWRSDTPHDEHRRVGIAFDRVVKEDLGGQIAALE
jgi:hypothetical protein